MYIIHLKNRSGNVNKVKHENLRLSLKEGFSKEQILSS